MEEHADILTHFGIGHGDMDVITLSRVNEHDVKAACIGRRDNEGNGFILLAHYGFRKNADSIIGVLTESIKKILSSILAEGDTSLAEAAILQQLTTLYHREDMPVGVGISGNRSDGHSLIFATLYVGDPHDVFQIGIAWGERFSPMLNQWYESITVSGGGVKCRVH